jgi:adenosylcobinamide amidohydrolase
MSEKRIGLSINDVYAKITNYFYKDFTINTLLIAFKEKHRVLSTVDGYREVLYVANTHTPFPSLSLMNRFRIFKRHFKWIFPSMLGLSPMSLVFLSTGVDMADLAICEKSCGALKVCCLVTAGAKNNALRTGVDMASRARWQCKQFVGTINVILLTNFTLSEGAMAKAVITVTEAKTAVLQDLNVRSTYSPQYQATGTWTDNVIVVSGNVGKPLTSEHTTLSELIGCATKIAVAQALRKHDQTKRGMCN